MRALFRTAPRGLPLLSALCVSLPTQASAQQMLGDQMSKARLLREPDPTFLSVRALLGPSGRLDAGTYAPPEALVGASLWVSLRPWPFAAFSVSLAHDWLGRERPPSFGATAFTVTRELTTGWATVELVPWPMRRHAVLGPFEPLLHLGVGLVGQRVSLSGQLATGPFAAPVVPVTCGGDAGPGVGLRVGVGARAQLTKDAPRSDGTRTDSGLWVVGTFGLEVMQVGASPVADCAYGAGTATSLGGKLGFEYEWNLTGGK